jgi:hypothetical protein
VSIPKYIFLDTNVFDAQAYNFESAAFKTFISASQAHGDITLLLPDPIEREVRRHIDDRATHALAALNDARRHAPFLSKWEHYPKKSFPAATDWQVAQIARDEWAGFLGQFTVKKLGYGGINPAQVMMWYDEGRPPFGSGKKKHEFPDAFAIAILQRFAVVNSCAVAIVSEDQDMRLACERRTSFLHFSKLPQLTELLVAGADQVGALRDLILSDLSVLDSALTDEIVANMTYYHSHRSYEITETHLEGVEFTDIRIVALGHGEATLAIEANVETTQHLKWQEQDYDDDWVIEEEKVLQQCSVHGTAKVQLNAKTRAIASVAFLHLEETELEVNEAPYRRYPL